MDFNRYWGSRIEFFKEEYPEIYSDTLLMNLLYDEAYFVYNKMKWEIKDLEETVDNLVEDVYKYKTKYYLSEVFDGR